MKKLLFCICTLVLMPILSAAQPEAKERLNWTTFAPANEIFSLDAPTDLATWTSQDDSQRHSSTEINGKYFFIFSEKADSVSLSSKTVLPYVRSYVAKGKIENIGIANVEKFEFKDDEGFFQTVAYFASNNREYIFHALTREPNDPVIKRFFATLKISGKPPGSSGEVKKQNMLEKTGTSSTYPIEKKRAESSTAKRDDRYRVLGNDGSLGTGIGKGGGNGTGVGTGLGSGSGGGREAIKETAPVMNKPLRILSKPKAPFTEMARLYDINGSVRLKVIFVANGTIGSVTPVTFLPFGLTRNAILAVRSVSFEPKMVNGIRISTTVTLQYGFYIFY